MESKLKIKMTPESPLFMGSGIGWGTEIDSDLIFDEFGLPYVPARRFKGLLRESALEVLEMMEHANSSLFSRNDFESLFGKASQEGRLVLNNLYPDGLEEYEKMRSWILWGKNRPNGEALFTREHILDAITSTRQSTAIDSEGIAESNTLRTFRVLNINTFSFFKGTLMIEDAAETDQNILCLACANLRRVGSMRSRGMGKVRCLLEDSQGPVNPEPYLERMERGGESCMSRS